MLHELLFALLGYTGDLIIDEREHQETLRVKLSHGAPLADEPTFKLAPDLSFLQPAIVESLISYCEKLAIWHWVLVGTANNKRLEVASFCIIDIDKVLIVLEVTEGVNMLKVVDATFILLGREVIERVITLGFYYRELERFAAKSRNLSWIRSSNESPLSRVTDTLKGKKVKPSVYRRALANGIVEVLSLYRSAVLHIEQKLLSDSMPILATVTQGLNKFFVLLPPLYELILEIERDNVYGGRLLNLLHKRCHCGVPELQTCIQRLLWHGHQVMYNQLASWMVYGILHDQYGEFFVSRQEEEDRDSEHDSPANVLEKLANMSTNDVALTDWHLGFHISLDMLPEYIPMHIAESILFAGKAIRVLRKPSHGIQFQGAPPYQQIQKGSQKAQGFSGRLSLQKDTSVETLLTGEELLPQSEADKIEAMLQDLKESSEFHKRSFETAVDSIKAIAANHLWQLVVVRADLNGHLKALKDYFLLAKGDFFQSFLEESRQLMRLPPRQSTAEADLMVPFQLLHCTKTALWLIISTSLESTLPLQLLCNSRMPGVTVKSSRVELPKAKAHSDGDSGVQSDTFAEMSIDGWDSIALEYSVDWPLHLFFTQEVLSKYLKIFQYLLRLKRTQMELEKSWASAMHQDHSDFAKRRTDGMNSSISQQRRQRFRPLWRVREHMAFLIRNLQFYIQVDVVESQWNVLQAHIQNSHDFTELVGFHQEYLSALISQSFLDIGSVSRILDGIMKLCLQFCWKIESQEIKESTAELEHIAEEFNKKSNSLYTILRSSRIAGSQRAPFLRRFLLRLNFNSFFEATARGVLNVVRPRPALALQ
ncbi:UNVERIFIED_CONTAM: Gamma-tubulin complex component 4 [Sesamum calycinum]|uniref:Gamma-tubulin complex component n=1 Tax=Sesamum calycinum TaxID=2727403 RepID=A0AAW2LVX5_9LAMI